MQDRADPRERVGHPTLLRIRQNIGVIGQIHKGASGPSNTKQIRSQGFCDLAPKTCLGLPSGNSALDAWKSCH
jgi:hypothetical protein